LKRLRLAVEILKRPQAVGTQRRVDQPPHRILDCALHLTGVLLRKHRIANRGVRMNAEITELQKRRSEKRNFLSRWLNNPGDRRHRRDRASSPASGFKPQRTQSNTEQNLTTRENQTPLCDAPCPLWCRVFRCRRSRRCRRFRYLLPGN